MTEGNYEMNQPAENIISAEGWRQIIKAIIVGKYSWACVLFLHFMGYEPTKYICRPTYLNLLENNFILPISQPNQADK